MMANKDKFSAVLIFLLQISSNQYGTHNEARKEKIKSIR